MGSESAKSFFFGVANGLTLARLLATPALVWLIVRASEDERYTPVALALIVLLQASDVLDGAIARRARTTRRERANPAGEILDPVADKLYINSAYLTLAVVGAIPIWVGGLVLARDALILTGWLARYFVTGDRMLPNVLGKAADTAQAFGLIVVLATAGGPWATALIWVVAGLTVISGLSYARMALSPA